MVIYPYNLQAVTQEETFLLLRSFSWTRNGTHFDIDKDAQVTMKPNSGTLVVNIMNGVKAEAYEGVYQCTARNERGAAISNNIVIRPSSKSKSNINKT